MQRIKTYKYPARNIFGDRSYAKFKWVQGQSITLGTLASSEAIQTFQFNDMSSLITAFGTSPNLYAISNLFERYRIQAIKITARVWPNNPGSTIGAVQQSQPICAAFQAVASNQSFPTPSVSNLPEQRWATYRLLNNANAGGKPSKVSAYFSVNKVEGKDQVVKNDTAYTGVITQGSTPTYAAPSIGPQLQFSVFSMTGALLDNTPLAIMYTVKAYVKFWGKVPAIQ